MEITGTIIKILPQQTGQGKNGEWKKQEFVIQTDGPYPKNVCFTVWNNKVNLSELSDNQKVKVSFDPESREFNGRYYTDLIAWRVGAAEAPTTSTPVDDAVIENQPEAIPDDTTDDLPF